MTLKEKRNKTIYIVANSCYNVVDDLKQIQFIDTIAGLSKIDFCNFIDEFINIIDTSLKQSPTPIKTAQFYMECEEYGVDNYLDRHLPDWVTSYLSQNPPPKCIGYIKQRYLEISQDFLFRYMDQYEIFDGDPFDGQLLFSEDKLVRTPVLYEIDVFISRIREVGTGLLNLE